MLTTQMSQRVIYSDDDFLSRAGYKVPMKIISTTNGLFHIDDDFLSRVGCLTLAKIISHEQGIANRRRFSLRQGILYWQRLFKVWLRCGVAYDSNVDM